MARKRTTRANTVLEMLESLTDLGVKVGGLFFVLVLGYMIYGLCAEHGFADMGSLSKPDRLKLIEVVSLLSRILWVSGTVCALSVAIRYYVEETLGYIISLLGVALYLGTPYVFGLRFPPEILAHNAAIAIITGSLRLLGMVVFLPGLGLIVRDVIFRVSGAISGRRKKVEKKTQSGFVVGYEQDIEKEEYHPKAYSQCWEMPYCRKFVRLACPIFLSRKPCWRMKKGCMCDGDIIMKALAAQSGEGSLFHKELQYRMGEVPTATKLTGRQKRLRCRLCVIYDFHQTQKYKLISPAIFPLVIAMMWFFYPNIERALRAAISSTDKFMKIVAFMPHADSGAGNIGMETPEFVYVAFVIWLGIMLISYALRLVEYCIFTMQI